MTVAREEQGHAHQAVAAAEGEARERHEALTPQPLEIVRAAIREQVLEDEDLAAARDMAGQALPEGQLGDEAVARRPRAPLGAQDEPIPLHDPDARGRVRKQAGRGLRNPAQSLAQIEARRHGLDQLGQRLVGAVPGGLEGAAEIVSRGDGQAPGEASGGDRTRLLPPTLWQ